MTFVTAVRKQTQQLLFGANSFKKLVIAQRTGKNVIEIRKKLRNVSGKLVTVAVEKIYRLFDMLSSFTASTHVRAENTRDNYLTPSGRLFREFSNLSRTPLPLFFVPTNSTAAVQVTQKLNIDEAHSSLARVIMQVKMAGLPN